MEMVNMKELMNFCKAKGYIYQGSEIYGGLANTWDYGPLGVELKNNLKKAWWLKFVQKNPNVVGLDSAILMNPKAWEASGHIGGFSDPLIDCKVCKTRHRADKLISEWMSENSIDEITDGWSNERMESFISVNGIRCPNCNGVSFTSIRQFNLMFKTFQGVVEDLKHEIYLRPETAQGIFVNFKNIIQSTRKKLPLGIAQIGKSFRNEITPGNFIFRVREFEQFELEFFCEPGTDIEWFEFWKNNIYSWLCNIGVNEKCLRLREHSEDELSFYSKCTTDIEYKFPFGWGELWGIADRTDYDLNQHMKYSNVDLTYFDPVKNIRYTPYCIEPSVSVERLVLAVLCSAYNVETLDDGSERMLLRLHPTIAPYKACIMPLQKKLNQKAKDVYSMLSMEFMVDYDETGSIGKRYRRQDEIGTPYCITIDFETMDDDCVTIRDRDSMKQVRIKISELSQYLKNKLKI